MAKQDAGRQGSGWRGSPCTYEGNSKCTPRRKREVGVSKSKAKPLVCVKLSTHRNACLGSDRLARPLPKGVAKGLARAWSKMPQVGVPPPFLTRPVASCSMPLRHPAGGHALGLGAQKGQGLCLLTHGVGRKDPEPRLLASPPKRTARTPSLVSCLLLGRQLETPAESRSSTPPAWVSFPTCEKGSVHPD